MKRCPVCKAACDDPAAACPRCRWDFSQDLLTHRSACAPTEAELSAFSRRLSEKRGLWRKKGRTALWPNLPAALLRLAVCGALFFCYQKLCAPPLLEALALGLALTAGALLALQWRRRHSFFWRFGAHALFPLAAGLAVVLFGGNSTSAPILLRAGLGAAAAGALLVEGIYYATNRFTLRPRMERGVETRAAFPRAQRGETAAWRKAELLFTCVALGAAAGLTGYIAHTDQIPRALLRLSAAMARLF